MQLARSLAAIAFLSTSLLAQQPLRELRGVWISNGDDVFSSRERISRTMEALADARFNVVFPAVWDGSNTLWHSPTTREAQGSDCDPAWGERDVLGEIVMEAHRFGLEVVPWFEAGFTARGALLDRKPEWAAIGKDKKPLVEQGERWLNALDPDVQQFFLALVLELARSYDIDGFAGSERFPALPAGAGWDAKSLERYKAAGHPGAPSDEKDPKWREWRATQLCDFLHRLNGAVNPKLAIVMSPRAPAVALAERLQDVQSWSERGLYHALALRGAAHAPEEQRKLVGTWLGAEWLAKTKEKLFAGVVARESGWTADGEFVVSAAATHRIEKLAGEAFFGCRALLDGEGALLEALADGPYGERAIPPWRAEEGWRPEPTEARPQAGSGRWTFADGDGPMVMLLDGGQKGDVSWAAKVRLPGFYEVYTWIPPGQPLGELARYQISTSKGLVTQTLRLDPLKGRGWVYLGQVQMPEYEEFEVARYEALEKDGTKVSAVGPVLLLYNRRANR